MREHNLAARTVSLWSYINSKQHKRRFKNYLYTAKRKASAAAGKPRHHPRPPASHSSNDDHDHTDDGESEDESDDEREENESDDESEARRQRTSEDGAGGGGGGEDEGRVLFPRTSVRRLKLWDAYYMRWMADLGADREADERDAVIARLHDDNKRLRRRLKARGLARQPQQNRFHGGDRTTAAK